MRRELIHRLSALYVTLLTKYYVRRGIFDPEKNQVTEKTVKLFKQLFPLSDSLFSTL